MKLFFTSTLVALSLGAAFLAGLLVSLFSQYAVWVLVYSGAAFMGGIGFGLRWERSWNSRQSVSTSPLDESSDAVPEQHAETVVSIKP